jgi:xanthine/uracil/vitamin C permease (AzgA family)
MFTLTLAAARTRRAAAYLALFLLALVALLTMSLQANVASASAASAGTNALVCRTVTTPPRLPWYSCINLMPGSPTGLPAGCYSTSKRVCD